MVPREPTEAMCAAVVGGLGVVFEGVELGVVPRNAWAAMLAAAPPPPQVGGDNSFLRFAASGTAEQPVGSQEWAWRVSADAQRLIETNPPQTEGCGIDLEALLQKWAQRISEDPTDRYDGGYQVGVQGCIDDLNALRALRGGQ